MMKNLLIFSLCAIMLLMCVGCGQSHVSDADLFSAVVSENSDASFNAEHGIDESEQAEQAAELADIYFENQDNTTIVATVNGAPIYELSLLAAKKSNEITYQNAMEQIDTMDITDEEQERYRSQFSIKSDSELLDQLIQKEVIVQEANNLGIEVTDEEAADYARSTYQQLEELAESGDAQNQNDYNFLNAYITTLGLTPEEYCQTVGIGPYKQAVYQQRLQEAFFADYSGDASTDQQTLYQNYIQSLVDNADMVITEK